MKTSKTLSAIMGLWVALAFATGTPTRCAELQGSNLYVLEHPAPANDMTLQEVNGEEIRLSDLRGRVLVLNFWRIDCRPCFLEKPKLEKMYRNFTGQPLSVLAVNLHDNPERIESYLDGKGYSYTFCHDPEHRFSVQTLDLAGGQSSFIVNTSSEAIYELPGVPVTYIIDKLGQVVAQGVGLVEWESANVAEYLSFLMRQPAPRIPDEPQSVDGRLPVVPQEDATPPATAGSDDGQSSKQAPARFVRDGDGWKRIPDARELDDSVQHGEPATAPDKWEQAQEPITPPSTDEIADYDTGQRDPYPSHADESNTEQRTASQWSGDATAGTPYYSDPSHPESGRFFLAQVPNRDPLPPQSPPRTRPGLPPRPEAQPYSPPHQPTRPPARRSQSPPPPPLVPDSDGYVTAQIPGQNPGSVPQRTVTPHEQRPAPRRQPELRRIPPPAAQQQDPLGQFLLDSFGPAPESTPPPGPQVHVRAPSPEPPPGHSWFDRLRAFGQGVGQSLAGLITSPTDSPQKAPEEGPPRALPAFQDQDGQGHFD